MRLPERGVVLATAIARGEFEKLLAQMQAAPTGMEALGLWDAVESVVKAGIITQEDMGTGCNRAFA